MEVRVLKALEYRLFAPDMVAVAIEAFRAERQALARNRGATLERRLVEAESSSSGIIA